MSRTLRLAVIQAALPGERDANLQIIDRLVRRAAADGAQVVLMPELFDGPYFPRTVDDAHRERAMPSSGHPTIEAMRVLARELEIVVPTSFYERDGDRVFNSVAMLDADGEVLGIYRKSHIPAGPGYEEEACFEADARGTVRVVPLQIAFVVLTFILSPVVLCAASNLLLGGRR